MQTPFSACRYGGGDCRARSALRGCPPSGQASLLPAWSGFCFDGAGALGQPGAGWRTAARVSGLLSEASSTHSCKSLSSSRDLFPPCFFLVCLLSGFVPARPLPAARCPLPGQWRSRPSQRGGSGPWPVGQAAPRRQGGKQSPSRISSGSLTLQRRCRWGLQGSRSGQWGRKVPSRTCGQSVELTSALQGSPGCPFPGSSLTVRGKQKKRS